MSGIILTYQGKSKSKLVGELNCTGSGYCVVVTSANFSTSTECPITLFKGADVAAFSNDFNKYLTLANGGLSTLPGGGFKVELAGFDAFSAIFEFIVFKAVSI